MEIPRGAYLTIVDPVLIESGLQSSWHGKAITSGTGSSWVRTEGGGLCSYIPTKYLMTMM